MGTIPVPHPKHRWTLPGWLAAVLWVATGVMGAVALLRIVAWDAVEVLVLLNSMSLFIFLPAWLIVAVAGVV